MESGRKVSKIWIGDESIASADDQQMVTLNEFHGEYDLDWVCIVDGSTGKEISRHNTKFIASIEWA